MAIVEPCLKGDWEKAAEQLRYHLERSKASAFQLVANTAAESGSMAQQFSL